MAREFPIVLQQNVVAGKTAVGAKIQAKLNLATLVNGTVIPRNAVLSGEVVESSAKSEQEPSRLSIRMDSAQWNEGSMPIKAYLTAWFYPTVISPGQDLQYGPMQPASRTWNGEGQYPDANSKVYRPFPGGDSNQNSGAPDTSSASTSHNRVAMKNVEAEAGADGVITIVSRHSNIKLDKSTTYILSSGELPAAK
ncbi:MAG TPA: hypothetical protein VMH04_09305 [Candidatus Solibacter sp.]|nr:hypothetical protein [Candidatus Solibacter sp.]